MRVAVRGFKLRDSVRVAMRATVRVTLRVVVRGTGLRSELMVWFALRFCGMGDAVSYDVGCAEGVGKGLSEGLRNGRYGKGFRRGLRFFGKGFTPRRDHELEHLRSLPAAMISAVDHADYEGSQPTS